MNLKYLIYFILTTSFVKSFSQSPDFITLEQSDNGEKIYRASNEIKFQEGYSFSASSSNKMTGLIDESKISDSEYGSLITSHDIDNKSIETSKMIGSITGNFSVDMIGGASYAIGIDIPKGINGVTPSLGINYNSNGGNNLLGVDWSLSGVSTISRVGQTHYLDNNVTPVKGDFDDRFSWDGQRLVLKSGEYGVGGSKYATANESFAEITAIGSNGKGPERFEMITKDGMRMDYGLMLKKDIEADSRLITEDGNTVLSWYLKRVTDLQGNYIEYKYRTSEDGSGIRLTEILYAGNENENISPLNRIKIDYKKREDENIYFIAGKKIKSTLLVKSISVFQNGNFMSVYSFKYANNQFNSFLTEIIKSGSDGVELNSTIFKYGENENDEAQYNKLNRGDLTNIDSKKHTFFNGDFNGDGLEDVLALEYKTNEEKNLAIYLNAKIFLNQNKKENNGFKLSKEISLCRGPFYFVYASFCAFNIYRPFNIESRFPIAGINLMISDLNGDGIDDLIFGVLNNNIEKQYSRYGALLSNFENDEITYSWSDEYLELNSYREDLSMWWQTAYYSNNYHTVSLGDFDGDGISELIGIDCKSENIYFKSFNGRVDLVHKANNHNINILSPSLLVTDYNGDGINEIIYKYYDYEQGSYKDKYIELNILNNNATIISEGTFTVSSIDYLRGNLFEDYNNRYMVDFNGDGLSDLIQIKKGEYNNEFVEIWLSIGSNNFDKSFTPLIFYKTAINMPPYIISDPREIMFRDINGDGKTNIVKVFSNHVRVYNYNEKLKNFDHINIPIKDQNDQNALDLYFNKESYFSMGDFNGDGNLELTAINPKWSDLNFTELNYSNSTQTRLLETIKDGLNNTTKIEYTTLSKGENYEFSLSENQYPINVLSGAIPIVKNVEQSDLFNRSHTTYYKYKNALIHKKGKGFLGYLESEVNNPVIGTYAKSKNVLKNYYTLVPQYQESGIYKNGNYEKVNETNSNVIVFGINGGKRIYTQVSGTSSENFITNTKVESIFTYDSYNNLLTENKNINQGKEIIISNYQYEKISSWIPSNLTYQKKSIYRNGDVHSTEIDYNYFTSGTSKGLLKQQINNQGKNYSSQVNYTYDGFGNVLSEKSSAIGMPTQTKTFEFDNNGLHVIKTSDNLNRFKTIQYHKKLGLPIKITDDKGFSKTNEYDNWGRLIKSTDVFGNETYIEHDWDIGDGNDVLDPRLKSSSLYKVTTSSQGSPSSTVWYDNQGREIMAKIESPAGDIYQAKSYDLMGNIYKETNNYGPTTPLMTDYYYDDYNRTERVESPNGTLEYKYEIHTQGVKTTVTNPNGSKVSTITDGTGKKIEVENLGNTPEEKSLLKYNYYASGQTKDIYLNNFKIVNMEFDDLGNQTLLNDVNSGATVYKYNNYGQIEEQIDANGKKYNITYDNLGRKINSKGPDGTTTYQYVSANENGRFKIKQITSPEGAMQKFEYDNYGRISKVTEVFEDYKVSEEYLYNSKNQLIRKTYSTGIAINYIYDNLGTLKQLINQQTGDAIYTRDEVNSQGKITKYTLGNGLTSERKYSIKGMLKEMKTDGFEYLMLDFEEGTGNLNMRENRMGYGAFETFEYDQMDRLKVVRDYNHQEKLRMEYESNGNIINKSDIGTYEYHSEKLNAVEKVKSSTNQISLNDQFITYTPFNKVKTISEGGNELEIKYGINNHRIKSELKKDNETIYTKFFTSLGIEKIIEGNQTTEITYIPVGDAVALYVNQNGSQELYYVYTDQLGSFNTVTDEDGIILYEQSFDAWGKRRNPTDWTYENIPETPTWLRGYTGHEHLPEFDLINMNGRVYDPLIGRMLSPDNYIQSPGFSQSYNRYSYVWNNPLKYTDPSGDLVVTTYTVVKLSLGIFLYTTEYGYDIQKFMSPIAFQLDFKTGKDQRGIGVNFSIGNPQFFGPSVRIHGGVTYYTRNNEAPKGWEFRYGYELGLFNGSLLIGQTNYSHDRGGGDFNQKVGHVRIGSPATTINAKYHNDWWHNDVSLGDRGDRWRTAALRVSKGHLNIGFNLQTGDPGKNLDDRKRNDISGQLFYFKNDNGDDPDKYRMGAVYIGFGSLRFGSNKESNRHLIQNKIVHGSLGMPYFNEINKQPDRNYFQLGTNTIW